MGTIGNDILHVGTALVYTVVHFVSTALSKTLSFAYGAFYLPGRERLIRTLTNNFGYREHESLDPRSCCFCWLPNVHRPRGSQTRSSGHRRQEEVSLRRCMSESEGTAVIRNVNLQPREMKAGLCPITRLFLLLRVHLKDRPRAFDRATVEKRK